MNAILEYLTCKEEDTLLNILRLFLALIANAEPIGKQICEENDNEAIYSLLNILKGPTIPMTHFSLKITFFTLTIYRALIQYSLNAKSFLVDDKKAMEAILNLIKPDQIPMINEQIESTIYSFLTQVVREEPDYKRIIGKRLLPICNDRISKCNELPLIGGLELKFFKMISVLVKN